MDLNNRNTKQGIFIQNLELLCFLFVRVSALLLPTIVLIGASIGGVLTYVSPLLLYGVYGIVTLLLIYSGVGIDNTEYDDSKFKGYRILGLHSDFPLYAFLAQHLIILPLIFTFVREGRFETYELVGLIISWGASAGGVGISVGHDLIHKKDKRLRWLGDFLWSLIFYSHFRISHSKGHHVNVGLPHDPATAREGESIWHFYPRSILMGYLQCWHIESRQLTLKGKSVFSLENYMWMDTFYKVVVPTCIYLSFGSEGLAFFFWTSLFAILIGETGNYFFHYGIKRAIVDGVPEPIQSKHSWDLPNKISGWFLFNAGRHSSHHIHPTAHYDELTMYYDRAAIKYGSPIIVIVCMIPPIFYQMMAPRFEVNTQSC